MCHWWNSARCIDSSTRELSMLSVMITASKTKAMIETIINKAIFFSVVVECAAIVRIALHSVKYYLQFILISFGCDRVRVIND